jgi:hypothetical protein
MIPVRFLRPQAILKSVRSLLFYRSVSSTMAPTTPWINGQYPPARRSTHVDVYKSETKGGVNVPDPYRWLEENSEETEQWTTAQEAYTRTYLDQNPDRKKLEDEIRKNTDYAKVWARSYILIRRRDPAGGPSPLAISTSGDLGHDMCFDNP